MIQTRIYVDGRISDEAGATVPVLDRGFLYGDSVYEVTRTAGGRPVDLGPHLDRLGRSAGRLRMMLPPRALDPAIKSGNYLNNILALDEARQKMAYEAILCDHEGRVTEGSSSNVWSVSAGVVRTPPTSVGILPGITRWRVLALAEANGILAEETELRPADLLAADEMFLTSSIRGVLPISQLDDRTLGVGPVTRRLQALYDAFLADVAAGRA